MIEWLRELILIRLSWGVIRQGRGLWSRNAVKGEQVRDERLRRDGKIETEVVESKVV